MRLDFDLDGTANSVYQVDVVADELGPEESVRERLPGQGDAAGDREAGPGQPEPGDGPHLEDRQSRACSTPSASRSATSSCPATTAFPFASQNAWWRKRAGFVNHHVWVTPYREDERHAAGNYPNQSQRRRRPDPAGPSRTARSTTPTWCSGTPSATPTFRGRRIIRSCRRRTSASCSSRTASSARTRPTTCRPAPRASTQHRSVSAV